MSHVRISGGILARFLVGIRKCQNILWQYDPGTYLHCQKVAQIAFLLGRLVGLDSVSNQYIYLGALVHDLGKITIPKTTLHKKTALTSAELAIVREHPRCGREIALCIMKNISDTEKQTVLDAIEYHHERPDGKGYLYGISGSEIPLAAKIVVVADALDAMVSYRPYRSRPSGLRQALKELQENSGSQSDAQMVERLVKFLAGRY